MARSPRRRPRQCRCRRPLCRSSTWIATAAGNANLIHVVFAVMLVACGSLILLRPLFDALRLLLSFLLSLISDGDLLVERVAPPERPNRW